MYFYYNSFPQNAGAWREALHALIPELHFIDSFERVAPSQVSYMLTWEPVKNIERFSGLRIVFSAGAGVDQFELAEWPSAVSLVRMVEPSIAQSMAEYVVFAVLALHRNMLAYRAAQANEQWAPAKILPAASRRVGIMGVGHLGRAALEKLKPFGYPLHGWNRSARTLEGVEMHTGEEALDGFLAQCDILVNLLPLTGQTRGIIDRALLAKLPAGAALVNVGRGAHVNEADLLAALDSGHLAAAVLDVFQQEPLPAGHPLWHHPRVWVTPHIASAMQVSGGASVIAQSIRRDRAGEPLLHAVDRSRGY